MYKNINRIIKNKGPASPRQGGLTLVELMVVVAIFLSITTTVIFNYGTFNSNVSLQNLTDDVALSIRKAQGFAIGARAIGEDFRNSYGMHFSPDKNPRGSLSGSDKSFLMFSVPTSPGSIKYTDNGSMNDVCGNGSNQCLELFNIMSADNIKELRIDDASKVSGSIDIIFTRPNTRAYFCYRENTSSDCTSASRVDIIISNGQIGEKERIKTISVQNTGQISIQ